MDLDLQKVLENIRQADTDDLIDRITAYRAGMEIDAIDMIEQELHRRRVRQSEIDDYRAECVRECLFNADGAAKMCSLCRKPAVEERWAWHRIMGTVPIMPRRMRFCKTHLAS